MSSMDNRNRKNIDAVIRKEQAEYPGSVALIGIYGSFMTGDVHPLSDLDLLILINDDRGWQLGKGNCPEVLGERRLTRPFIDDKIYLHKIQWRAVDGR